METNKDTYSDELLALFCEGKTDKDQSLEVIQHLLSNEQDLHNYESLFSSLEDELKERELLGTQTPETIIETPLAALTDSDWSEDEE